MNLIGEVVFCVDCDRAGSAQPNSTATEGPVAVAVPRRMATKKDTNGDALCTTCLDARLGRRRREFVLHQGGAAPVAPAPTAAPPAADNTRRFIPSAALRSAALGSSRTIAPTLPKETHVAEVAFVPTVDHRELERRFQETVIAVGFVRARDLLDELRGYAATLAKRPR
jgi:hypothetical protein